MSALCTNGNTPNADTGTQHEHHRIDKESGGGAVRTSAGDGRAHERVELFVAADGELEVAGGYALYAQVF